MDLTRVGLLAHNSFLDLHDEPDGWVDKEGPDDNVYDGFPPENGGQFYKKLKAENFPEYVAEEDALKDDGDREHANVVLDGSEYLKDIEEDADGVHGRYHILFAIKLYSVHFAINLCIGDGLDKIESLDDDSD